MQCPRQDGSSAELMIAYAAGALEPQAQIEWERHLDACEECRAVAANQKAVWEALDSWKPSSISADFNERVYRRIAQEEALAWWRRPLRNWSSFLRPSMPLAAACAALVIAFVMKDIRVAPSVPVSPGRQVSIEQVERALDDMDLLKQLSAPAAAEPAVSGRI